MTIDAKFSSVHFKIHCAALKQKATALQEEIVRVHGTAIEIIDDAARDQDQGIENIENEVEREIETGIARGRESARRKDIIMKAIPEKDLEVVRGNVNARGNIENEAEKKVQRDRDHLE